MAAPYNIPSVIGPNPPFPPYPPLTDLKLPESRLGCLLLGGLAGFVLATLLRDAADARREPKSQERPETAR